MSSHNNRRLRGLRRRHRKAAQRLTDRIRTLREQGRHAELKAAMKEQAAMQQEHETFRRRKLGTFVYEYGGSAPGKPLLSLDEMRAQARGAHAHMIGELKPTSLVMEKQEPKVHGVNAQREMRTRPKVGGARGRNPGT